MTTSSRPAPRRSWTVLAIVAAALVAVPATTNAQPAQPSAADLESARELYKEAKALRDKGDLRGALERFKAAHAYGQTPVTGLELGRTHMQLGELVEAREALLSVGRMKVASDETDKSAGARSEASDLAEQIRPRIPTLNVKITGVPEGTQAQVSVDGAVVPVVAFSAVRKANPGAHVVVAKVGSREEKRSIELKEGEAQDLAIAFDGASAGAGGAAGTSGAGGAGPESPSNAGPRDISVVTWIGGGVAVAGLGVGAVTGLMAMGKASDAKKACSGLSCPPATKTVVDSGRTLATVSTVSFVVGGAGIGAALVGYFLLSKPKTTGLAPQVQVVASPSWVGLDGAF